jgi:predicted nucleic-acid-binding protein
MRGVDTNVVLRLFVVDDQEQHRMARSFFDQCDADNPASVSLVVVVELAWLLRSRYGYPQEQVLDVLEALTNSVNVHVQDPELVEDAIANSRNNKAGLCRRAGCSTIATFDRRAARKVGGMELLS